MAPPATDESFNSALVVGGCGFIGSHIVQNLLLEPGCSISVASRNPNANRYDGVSYHAGDITDPTFIRKLLSDVKPGVVFHVASPTANDPSITPEEQYKTNVDGTRNLLDCAKAEPSVKAFVYTSTAAVAKGYEHFNIDETAPLWEEKAKVIPYMKAKTVADILVREANTPTDSQGRGLLTAAIRLAMVYGERDTQYIPGQLAAVMEKQTKVQLGDGKNFVEPTYVGNVATAHILTAKALLTRNTGRPKVDGEAFVITDGDPQPFWDFTRRTWRHAGDQTKPEEITVIPAMLVFGMAGAVEWLYYIFTLGQVRPPLKMSRLYLQYTILNTTYNINKAKERLGYNPIVDHDAHLKNSIEWALKTYPDRYKGLTVV